MLGVHGQEIRKPRGRSALQKDTPNSCAFSFQIVKTEAFPAGIVSVFKRFFLRQAHAVRTPCGEKICFLSRMISVSKPNDSPFRLTIVKNRP